MKRAKRFLSLLLTLCMFLGMLPGTVFAADSSLPFTDVKKSDWYYEAVQYVYDNGMMSGTGANTFSPNTTTTRGMIVTILHRMEGTPAVAGEKFTDVPAGQYYSKAVAWASANSIVSGYGNGTFGPDDPITREQMAAILYRYAQYKGYDVSQSADLRAFTDADAISQYAKNAMAWANAEGLMNGVTRTTLGPKGNATRAQVAAMLMRYCENVASTNQIPSNSPTPDPTPTPTPDVFYTVTFESNGGSKIASQDVRKGEKVAKPDDPAKDGCTFTGWYVDEELTTAFDFETPITSDLTLYAGWEEVEVWRVTVNGKSVTLTTMPQVVDGEVYVPMIPVLTAMNFEVVWNEGNETLIAVRNGFVTRLIAGEMSGLVNGEKAENLANTVEVMKRNPYGSAALLQEVFGAVLTADTESLTATVTCSVPSYLNWFDANNFSELGTWKRTGSYLQGIGGGSTLEDALAQEHETQPAVLYFTVPEDGTYHLWIEGRDFTTNQPGDRYFNAAIDGVQSTFTFGNHTVDSADNSGADGFYWEDGGVFNLTAGTHKLELLDSSTFFARCNGVMIAAEPFEGSTYNPNQDIQDGKSLSGAVVKYDAAAADAANVFPTWATAEMTTTDETVSIENGTTKVVFYKGSDTKGHSWVQNEIYIYANGVWTLVKERTEELGWLMQRAISSEYLGVDDSCATLMSQTIENGESTTKVSTVNYFAAGKSTWFIPEDITKISDKEVKLSFQTDENAELTVTYGFDDLAEEPKVTLDVKFKNDGAYSFLLFSGDGVDYEDFERVTAPLLYIKKDMPDEVGAVISDSWLFTPMSTFTYPEGTVTAGQKFTSGVVMDPSCIDVEDQYSYPDTARFGTTFKTIDGQYRNQLVAPMFGTDNCVFKSGDDYSVSYRLVNRNEDWFDTYKHITEDLYNLQDVRENYYASLNEAIYNTVDMIMDDVYSGWDENAMGFYNMEGSMLVSHSNPLIMVQQYLLTEDEEFLTDRTIPTLAYILSRGSAHFAYDTSIGGMTSNYAGTNGPSVLKTTPTNYGTNVYNALYEMTQGRVPFFMDYALNKVNNGYDSAGLLSSAALYQIAVGSRNDELAALIVKTIVSQADSYMTTAVPFQMDSGIVNSFVYMDYVDPLAAFLAAYEVTGEAKYLNAAEKTAQLLTTSVWTTGYQNDNVTSTTHLDADQTLARDTNADASGYDFFWYGDVKWRPGESWADNYNAQNDNDKSPLELSQLYPDQVTEALTDDVPSWLLAKAGMGTEHVRTPGHGNVITMNSYAGTLEKLAQLTGEDYFETMSRSAILGRFSTYAGYYNDRNIVYQMKENWYEDGPDFTNIYWHHIPIFLSILEDYLINSVYVQSEGNVTFPSSVYNGYAYFHTNHYGYDSGEFYDQDDMWLWLDEGIVSLIDDGSATTRNSNSGNEVNVDYIAARKDGVLGLAFVNEDDLDMSATITLGGKVPGGSRYSGTAVVYDAAGNKSTVTVTNGTFTLDIPAKGIRSVVLNIAGVQAPAYAKTESYALSNAIGDTVLENTDDGGNITGKSYVLQMTDEEYFAYVYTTRMATEDDATNGIDSLTIRYTTDGGTTYAEETDSLYPFEFIVKVTDPNAAFEYTLTGNKAGGAKVNLGSGTLKTLTGSSTEAKLSIPDNVLATFVPLEESWKGGEVPATKLSSAYVGNASGNLRVIANISDFTKYVDGGNVTENCLRGLKVYGIFTNKSTGEQSVLESWVTGNEMRTGQTVLIVPATAAVPSQNYDNYTYVIAFGDADTTEEEFLAALNGTGADMSDMVLTGQITNVGTFGTSSEDPAYMRLVIEKRDDIDVVDTVGMKVVARLVGKDDTDVAGTTLWLDSTVKEGGSNQAGTAWVLSVDWTEEVPWQDRNYYSDNYIIHYVAVMPENELADTDKMKAYITEQYPLTNDAAPIALTCVTAGAPNGEGMDPLRLVIEIPTEVTKEELAKMKIYARIENKLTGELLWLDTTVQSVGDRNETQYNLEVYQTEEVPANAYQADYQIVLYAIDPNSKMANLTDMKAYINEKHPLIFKPDNVPAIVSGGSVINNGTVGADDNSGQMRLVVNPVDDVDPANLVGRKLVARLVSKTDSTAILWMETTVVNASVRSDTNWNVEVNWTEDVPYQAGNYYANNYNVAYVMVKPTDEMATLKTLKAYLNGTYPVASNSSLTLFNSVVTNGAIGALDNSGQMRLVVKPLEGVEVTALTGQKMVARLVSKTDSTVVLWMDTMVVNASVRTNSDWNVEVNWTENVPFQAGNYYANNYNIVFVTVASDDEMADFETLKYYIQAHA